MTKLPHLADVTEAEVDDMLSTKPARSMRKPFQRSLALRCVIVHTVLTFWLKIA